MLRFCWKSFLLPPTTYTQGAAFSKRKLRCLWVKLPGGTTTWSPWNAGQSGDRGRLAGSTDALGPLSSRKWVGYSILYSDFGGRGLISHLYSPSKCKVLWKAAQSTFVAVTEEAWSKVRWILLPFALGQFGLPRLLDVCEMHKCVWCWDNSHALVHATSGFFHRLSDFFFLSSFILLNERDERWRDDLSP